ncbi:unannotated protein [freshwater metagenome]|uniref:Unannotated protein n=1 Tax=freshwater metagenome TaxID=449393 RepID=A0A6J7HD30_9ZZZZ|nr:hypothetical protein [Actinomycetota bacterium]
MRGVLSHLTPGATVRSPNIAGSVYGLILTASVIAASSESHGDIAGRIALFTGTTLVIFWGAHCYAQTLGAWADRRETPTPRAVLTIMRREWTMVSAGIPPLLVLVIGGTVRASSDRGAINAALALVLVELALACGYTAYRAGAGVRGRIIATAIGVAMAGVVILLKTLVH